jgi:hypothetical protein
VQSLLQWLTSCNPVQWQGSERPLAVGVDDFCRGG